MIVLGVDGCRMGWVTVAWNTRKKTVDLEVFDAFADVMAAYPSENARAIAVDIPIGLIDGVRRCDVEARAELRCRKSSVFPAPYASLAGVTDYSAANAISKERFGKGISAQAFGIYRKVHQVNELMRPNLQDRIIEVHPELCFWAMNGREDVCATKHSGPGYLKRLELLRDRLDLLDSEWGKIQEGIPGAQADDVLDALAATWTARRWVNGSFGRFPAEEQRDEQGLRAEIVY